jgi:hypothetical protein
MPMPIMADADADACASHAINETRRRTRFDSIGACTRYLVRTHTHKPRRSPYCRLSPTTNYEYIHCILSTLRRMHRNNSNSDSNKNSKPSCCTRKLQQLLILTACCSMMMPTAVQGAHSSSRSRRCMAIRGGACALPKTAQLLPRGGSGNGVTVGSVVVGSGVTVAGVTVAGGATIRGPHQQRPFTALSATTVGKRS